MTRLNLVGLQLKFYLQEWSSGSNCSYLILWNLFKFLSFWYFRNGPGGATALMGASRRGHSRIVELLLQVDTFFFCLWIWFVGFVWFFCWICLVFWASPSGWHLLELFLLVILICLICFVFLSFSFRLTPSWTFLLVIWICLIFFVWFVWLFFERLLQVDTFSVKMHCKSEHGCFWW